MAAAEAPEPASVAPPAGACSPGLWALRAAALRTRRSAALAAHAAASAAAMQPTSHARVAAALARLGHA